jgi:hypothetical protein
MSHDPTEDIRRREQAELNARKAEREALEKQYGQVWDTKELQEYFRVEGFLAPYVVVVRLSDNQKGTLQFQHSPRFYFNFVAD